MIQLCSLIDLTGFQVTSSNFTADTVGAPVDALVDLWNEDMTQEIDMFIPSAFFQVQEPGQSLDLLLILWQ